MAGGYDGGPGDRWELVRDEPGAWREAAGGGGPRGAGGARALERLWPLLRDLDGAARCGICKEVLQGAVSAPCGHSFCALCLRTALAAQASARPPQRPHCPVCRAGSDTPGSDALQVRPALQVQALVAAFQEVREPLLGLFGSLAQGGGPAPPPASAAATAPDAGPAGGGGAVRGAQGFAPAPESTGRGSGPGPAPRDACECPICGRFYSSELIAQHVDLCLARQEHNDVHAEAKRERERGRRNELLQQQRRQQQQQQRSGSHGGAAASGASRPSKVAMLCYQRGVLSDRELKRHLANLGLPTTGGREALVARHKDFSNRFNAAIDSGVPKSAGEVAAEVQQGERAMHQAAGGAVGRRKLGLRGRPSAGGEIDAALFRKPADPAWLSSRLTSPSSRPRGGKENRSAPLDPGDAAQGGVKGTPDAAPSQPSAGDAAPAPSGSVPPPPGRATCSLCGAAAGTCGCPEAGAFPETMMLLDSDDEDFEVPTTKKPRRQSSRLQSQ